MLNAMRRWLIGLSLPAQDSDYAVEEWDALEKPHADPALTRAPAAVDELVKSD